MKFKRNRKYVMLVVGFYAFVTTNVSALNISEIFPTVGNILITDNKNLTATVKCKPAFGETCYINEGYESINTVSEYPYNGSAVTYTWNSSGKKSIDAIFSSGNGAAYVKNTSFSLSGSGTFEGIPTLRKNCGSDKVYIGPDDAKLHGGVCIKFSNPLKRIYLIHADSTQTKYCGNGGHYVGANRPDFLGGHCLWVKGHSLSTTYTRDKNSCNSNEIYVGPNKAGEHGGYCLSAFRN